MTEEKQDWIAEVEKEKEKIKNWKLTDRLSVVSKLSFMNGSVAASVTGWNSWLTSALVMELLTEEELTELSSEFERLALAFLELDIKYTKLVKERQKLKRPKLSNIGDKNKYIA